MTPVVPALAILLAAAACAPAAPLAAPTVTPGAPTSTSPAAAPASPSPIALGKGRSEKGSLGSRVLARTFPYLIYLPPGYDNSGRARYPVAYVLHGGSGLYTEWVDYGLLDAADRLMGSGEIPPFIIVLPQGDQEYWVDHVVDASTGANGERWGTYVAREVVTTIDANFRTVASPPGRAIGGLSMGGHAAIQLPLNFPGVWSAIAATSPSIRPEGEAPTYLGFGAEFAARDPLSLIKAKPDLARQYAWWIDVARTDPWFRAAVKIHETLTSLGIPHEWDTPPGDHSAKYWSEHVEDYLRFYASVLCRDAAACPGRTR